MVFSSIRVRGDRFACPCPLWTDSFTTCSANCKFCFVKETEENFKNFPVAEATNLKTIEGAFAKAFSEKEYNDPVVVSIKNRLPLGVGSRCDPFQNEELKLEQTLKILKIAKDYNYPVIINTKFSRVAMDKYLKILGELENPTVIINLLNSDQQTSTRLEPEVSPQMDRWAALEYLNHLGIRADLRIAPLLPDINDSEKRIKNGMRKAKKKGVKFVAVEYYHLRYPNIANVHFKEAGIEFEPIYNTVTKKGYFTKKAEIFSESAKELGLKVAFPDWIEAPFSSDLEACCGTSDRYNYYKCTFQHALKLLEKGKLDWKSYVKSIDFFLEKDEEKMKELWRKKSIHWSLWDLDQVKIIEYDSEGLPIFKREDNKGGLNEW